MTEAHERLEAATAALTESKRLRSKVNRVLEVLLKGKYLSQIVEALHKLGECSISHRLWRHCTNLVSVVVSRGSLLSEKHHNI